MGDRYQPARRDAFARYERSPRSRYEAFEERERRSNGYDRYESRRRSPSPFRDRGRGADSNYDRYDSRYEFGRERDGHYTQRPEETFSFRAINHTTPRFPSPDRHPPAYDRTMRHPLPARPGPDNRPSQTQDMRHDGQGSRFHSFRRDVQPQRGRGGFRSRRGGFQKPKPHMRNILNNVKRGGTPEQLEGMNSSGQPHFLDVDFASEDDKIMLDPTHDDHSSDEGEARAKRVKSDNYAAEVAVPKWSNPDPYTSLPCPESLGAPKKDIVQVIRKAKVESARLAESSNAVKENNDFISFFSDVGSEEGEASDVSPPLQTQPAQPRNAPSAPASMRELAKANGNTSSNTSSSASFRPDSRLPSRPQAFESNTVSTMDSRAPPPLPPDGVSIPTNEELAKVRRDPNVGKNTITKFELPRAQASLPPPPPPPGILVEDDNVVRPGKRALGRGKRKREQQTKTLGEVIDEWESDGSNPTPWCVNDWSGMSDMGERLHNEICEFMAFVQPHDYEEKLRGQLIHRVQEAVRRCPKQSGGKDVEIRCFGSFAAGLYLPTADMDLVAVSQTFLRSGHGTFCQTRTKVHVLARHIADVALAAPGSVSPVARAKVPIVKFVDELTGLRVDISFENDSGLIANRTFQEWKAQHPAMPTLVVLVKQLLAMRGLNEVFSGGIGGFSIICLVVSMLQQMPAMQPDTIRYDDLFLKFLDLYGNRFDIYSTGIMMEHPYYFNKITNPMLGQNASGLTIIDPNRPTNDISGGSREIAAVLKVFSQAHASIHHRLAQLQSGQARGSVLECVLGGNYSSFMYQRDKLSMLQRGLPAQVLSGLPPYAILPRSDAHGSASVTYLSSNDSVQEWMPHAEAIKPIQASGPTSVQDSTQAPLQQKTQAAVETPIQPQSKSKKKKHKANDANGATGKPKPVLTKADLPHVDKGQPGAKAQRKVRKKARAELRKEQEKQRSAAFKQQYPWVPSVPNSLNKSQRRKLVEKAENTRPKQSAGAT